MKILWHMPTLRRRTCGLSNRARHLAMELQSHGHFVSFVVAGHKTDIGRNQIDGIRLEKIQLPPRRAVHWCLQAIDRRRSAGQIICRLDDVHDLFISCQPEVVSAYRRAHPRRPIVFVCGGSILLHDPLYRDKLAARPFPRRLPLYLDHFLIRRNEARAFDGADAIVFDSFQTRKIVMETYGPSPDTCKTIYGGVETTSFHPPSAEQRRTSRRDLNLAPEDRVITWTGRLSEEKNLDHLIRSLPICDVHPLRVFIVGGGPCMDEWVELCHRKDVDDIVTFVGEQDDVRPFLHAADLFVFPSRAESCGLAMIEAMACGLPCLSIRGNGRDVHTASEELLEGGRCGALVSTRDTASFARAIDELFRDPRRRCDLGDRAARRAKEWFSWSGGGRKLNDLITAPIGPCTEVDPSPAPSELKGSLATGVSS